MSNRGLVVPVDGRRMISTVAGVLLIAVGVIVRFTVTATSADGLNAHAVSLILMLAGSLGLLLSLLAWGPRGRRRDRAGGAAPLSGRGIPGRAGRHRRARRRRDRESGPPEGEYRAARRAS